MIDFQLDLMLENYKMELASLSFEQYLHHHFAFIQENASYFIALYQNGLSSLTDEKFSGLLPDTMPIWSETPIEQQYRSTYTFQVLKPFKELG